MADIQIDPGSIQLPPQSATGNQVQIDPGSIQLPSAPVKPAPIRRDVALARGIAEGGTFGAASTISAAIDTAANKVLPQKVLDFIQNGLGATPGLPINQPATYDQRRAAYQQLANQSATEHPGYTAAGEVIGGLAVPAPGSAEAAQAVTKGLGSGLGARLAGAVAGAGVAGAEYGAGSALGQGAAPVDVLKQAAKGAGVGAVTGAALHGAAEITSAAAKKAQQALQDKYVKTFGAEVLGNTNKKATTKAWAAVLGKEPEPGVTQTATKYIQSKEMQPVEAAARAGKYDEAIAEVDKNLQKYSPSRIANYQAIDEAKPFEVGKGLDSIDAALFKARNSAKDPGAVKALEKAKQDWIRDFSSADADQIQRVLRGSSNKVPELIQVADQLPQTGRISRTQWANAAKEANAGPDAIRFMTDIENATSGPGDNAPAFFRWDPKANIPAVELRSQASLRQQSALQAFDALNPNYSSETKTVVKKAIVSALEKHLDAAAEAGGEATQEAVKRIRNDDVKFSVLLAAKQGLKEAQEKAQRQDMMLKTVLRHVGHVGTIPAAVFAAGQAGKTAEDVEKGNVTGALEHGGLAALAGGVAGRGIYRGASIANNRLSTALQGLPPGSGLAQTLAQRLPQAAIGTTTLSTVGQQQGAAP